MATTNKFITNIVPTIAPRLPAAPAQYDARFFEQYSNILRLYFNGIDTTFGGLLGQPQPLNTSPLTFKSPPHPGGVYLNFPYAACRRTTNQTFTANTATLVTLDTNDFLNDCTNTGTDGIKANNAGVYNYQFSIQFSNSDSQIHSCWVWLRINGVDVVGTASKFDIISSHGGTNGFVIGAANFYVQLNAGDHVDLYAAVDNTAVTFVATNAQTSPFAMPSIPSVVATLSFVSSIPT
jgi:hypothetical protein